MGLDMYLTYQYNTTEPIEREIMYWRKQNAIHKWFVMNVQNGEDQCVRHVVTEDDIGRLLHACRVVVAARISEKAEAIAAHFMPTGEGFFFGSTEYDEWYYDGLMKTITTLETFLSDIEGEDFWSKVTVHYQSSW